MQVLNAYLEDDSTIVAVHRDPHTGAVRGRRVRAEWVCYLRRAEVSRELERDLRESRYVRSIEPEGDWLRVGWTDRFARKQMTEDARSPIRHAGAKVYEGDVHPVRRWMIDAKVTVDRPRACFLDIETDSRVPFRLAMQGEARVLSWVVVDGETGEHVARVLLADDDAGERGLLDELWETLRSYDQVFAWGSPVGDTFDFEVIFARSRMRGCAVDTRRWLWSDYLQVLKRLHSADTGDEKASWKLEDVGQEIVKEGKEQAPVFVRARFGSKRSMGALAWDLWEAGGEFRDALVRYMIKDGVLLWKIDAKKKYARLFQTLCEVSGVFGDSSGLQPSRQLDAFLLRLGKERGYHFPTKTYGATGKKFKGAYVMRPRARGIERDVHVGDFKSLYPAIIISLNMSPDTRTAIAPEGPIPEGFCRAPITGVGFRLDVGGMLADALREMLRLRAYWSAKADECAPGTPEWLDAYQKSTAYKVAANSFYGVIGLPSSRYYDPAVGEAITQTAVFLIKATIDAAEELGMRCIYTDTDSVFISGSTRAEFESFVGRCNAELYPRIMREHGCRENLIKLAYEKQLARIVFPMKEDGDLAAKKYVASYVHRNGKLATADSKPEIKGIEVRRGDSCKLARKLQERVIDMLVGGMQLVPDVPTDDVARYHALLAKARDYVLRKPVLAIEEVKKSQGLKQGIDEYEPRVSKACPEGTDLAHVAIARVLQARGQDVREGTRIEYVIVDASCSPMKAIPAEDYEGECDRYYLWEKLVFPPSLRLLETAFPDYDWTIWSKARPAKPRGSSKVCEEQEALPGVDLDTPTRPALLVVGPTPIAKRSLRRSGAA